ncbi:riboflavin biosynthesis protein RibD [Neisseria elongata subsp. glycolytica ATCC 29315]|uniref:5-amino-6-(5-phosphoribosylamino)uracil reductase n=1 Tax=Neisseria elongata subsp. glycolytica ATCC 29315 TaxID=546263 RepID=D4DSF0_NEIEG|nr:riboflavin biosynthesis protein RibD [Neisseria elongata subsp. glycolytica ATCC 29315]
MAGKGLSMLSAAGIRTESGLLETEARELNRGFLSRIERGRPFVRLKCAASLDGKTALSDGLSQWITGEAARHDVQILRAESCAVLTGIGTVLADDPQLNVRAFPTLRQPLRIVLDSRLRLPPTTKLLADPASPVLLLTAVPPEKYPAALTAVPHLDILTVPAADGRISLPAVLTLLAERGIGELLVEAGATLCGAFLQAGLADEIVLYQAGKILGGDARSLFDLPENPAALQQPASWQTRSVAILDGGDLKQVLRKKEAV